MSSEPGKSTRHHYVPRFFLRRFGITDGHDELWVLNKDGVRRRSSRQVGFAPNFHPPTAFFGDPEQLISQEEKVFREGMAKWEYGQLPERAGALASRFIVHLRLRSRIMRAVGNELMTSALVSADVALERNLATQRPALSMALASRSILEKAAQLGASGSVGVGQLAELEAELQSHVQQKVSYWSLLEAVRGCRFMMAGGVPEEILAGTHVWMILMTVFNRKLSQSHQLTWSVVRPDGPLVLGDVGPLVKYPGARRLKPLLLSDAPVDLLLLPLSPTQLLVGSPLRRPRVPTHSALNKATASLSHEFVVGAGPRRVLDTLAPVLGSRVAEDTPEVIFGTTKPDGGPMVDTVVEALLRWFASRVDAYWNGDAARIGELLDVGSAPKLPLAAQASQETALAHA